MELLYIPLATTLAMFLAKGNAARQVAYFGSLAQLALTVFILSKFNADGSFNFLTQAEWIKQAGITFKVGIDGISMLMVLLTNLLVPIIISGTFRKEIDNPSLFYGLVSLMHVGLIGVFISLDGILFYIFWEITLIPIYFICAIWGGENKNRITLKFFIYTFFGSLFMLASLIVVKAFSPAQTFDIENLYAAVLPTHVAVYVLIGFFLAFAIKMPVFPFHTWQPDTYTVSPLGGTLLLSGIMLKMGVYGVIRWMIPMAPEGLSQVSNWFIGLAIVGVVYAGIIAIMQKDFKRLVAYSSISHVGLIAAGVFTFTHAGLQGSMIQMLNHGINVVALFLVVDYIERRIGTRQLADMGGFAKVAPKFAVLFMIIMLGNVAVPLTNGFVGELLLLKGVFDFNIWYAVFAGLTVIFCAVYMLRVYQLSMFGPSSKNASGFKDADTHEIILLGVLCMLILILGVYPQPIFELTDASINNIIQLVNPQP
jgi:NADH-quinone oxidoreductase subunit M